MQLLFDNHAVSNCAFFTVPSDMDFAGAPITSTLHFRSRSIERVGVLLWICLVLLGPPCNPDHPIHFSGARSSGSLRPLVHPRAQFLWGRCGRDVTRENRARIGPKTSNGSPMRAPRPKGRQTFMDASGSTASGFTERVTYNLVSF